MAKPKFTLALRPTFVAKVAIPVPGDGTSEVAFTFKARTREQFRDFLDNLPGREDVDVILDIASGWELEDAYDRAGVEKLTENYLGAARAVIETYLTELTQARLGN